MSVHLATHFTGSDAVHTQSTPRCQENLACPIKHLARHLINQLRIYRAIRFKICEKEKISVHVDAISLM